MIKAVVPRHLEPRDADALALKNLDMGTIPRAPRDEATPIEPAVRDVCAKWTARV